VTEYEWREVLRHLSNQGFVVESVDRATGRIVLHVPTVRATDHHVTSQQGAGIGTPAPE
jgi:hypothetical protein